MVTPAGPYVQYQVNPRFVPDDTPVWLGNNKDSAIIFDNANNELTLQTKNLAGTLTDRVRIKANQDAVIITFLDGTTTTKLGATVAFFSAAGAGQAAAIANIPAGGTGAAEGAWDTAANRNAAITSINSILTVLRNLGLVAP